jgi:GWxTD domain-containing protein
VARAVDPTPRVSLASWIEGPVHYIARAEEVRAFKDLRTDEERALFIERFWARRDSAGDTLANETRQAFWERVQRANTMFLDSHKPGWATDRGKIYVLHGPPTTIEDYPDLQSGGPSRAGTGVLRWIYEGRPGGRTDMNPVVIVAFAREPTGEYRISYDPQLSSVFFNELAVREGWDRGRNKFLELMGAPRATEMSVMLDLGRMQEVPPQARVLLERVETTASFATRPLQVSLSRYAHPDRRAVVAVITADVTDLGDPRPAAIARFAPHDATQATRMLGEDSFRLAEADGRRVVQGRIVLDPGDYDLTLMVVDPKTAATGMNRSTFHAALPESSLQLSDAILALELAPVDYAALASHDEPFHVGAFRVVPRPVPELIPGQAVRVFYEIYGGTPPWRIEYRLEGREADGRWTPLGKPSSDTQSARGQGWDLPTSDAWPAGEYRIQVNVRDSAQAEATAEVGFRIGDRSRAPG